jgi:ADP-heptose:LPS heptosyltransferase
MPLKGLKYPRHTVVLSRLLEVVFFPFAALIRKAARNHEVKRILIVEPFNLGDVISLAIMFEPLRRRFPKAQIHLLTKGLGNEIYREDPRITKIHAFEFPWAKRGRKWDPRTLNLCAFFQLIRKLRKASFDIGIDTRGDIRTQILMVLLGCKVRVGYTNYLCSNVVTMGLLLTHSAGELKPTQRFLINLEVIRQLGCAMEDAPPRPLLRQGNTGRTNKFTVLCHPGAGWKFRLWQNDRWIALINKMVRHYDVSVRVIGEQSEGPHLVDIRKGVPQAVDFKITTLADLVSEIRTADLILCLDSGPMHIAAAYEKPLVALFGPGHKDIWKPYSLRSCVIEHQNLYPCAPCLQKRCLFPEANCMDAITPEEVFEKVSEMIPDAFRGTGVEDRR